MLPQHIRKAAEDCLAIVNQTHALAEVSISAIHEGRRQHWLVGTRRGYAHRDNEKNDPSEILGRIQQVIEENRAKKVSWISMKEIGDRIEKSSVAVGRVVNGNLALLPKVKVQTKRAGRGITIL